MFSVGRRLASFLRLPGRVASGVQQTRDEVTRLRREIADIRQDMRTLLQRETAETRRELGTLLRHYNLQLGKLAHKTRDADHGEEEGVRLSTKAVPLDLDAAEPKPWQPMGGNDVFPDPDGREWLRLEACPVCGAVDFTIVNEWNKFLLLPKAPDPESVRYDYAVCHSCGVLFATRRPFGARFRYLLANFGEATGKRGGSAEIANPLLNPYPLAPQQREELRRMAAHGAFVSDHLGLTKGDYITSLFSDRVENSIHLDVIASLAAPGRGAKVLEIRSRAGTILEGLRRLFGADVYAMPIWESQQFLLQEVYGIQASALIDFDRFDIPFDTQFDIVIANHMFTHVIRPREFFAAVRARLRPGGYLYLHNEPDDTEFLKGNQSIIATLNPLHVQAFDQASLVRALAANGFTVAFIKARGDLKHLCLARVDETATLQPPTPRERDRRIRLYQRARARAILKLDPDLRPRVASVWQEAVEVGVAEGIIELDEKGAFRLVAPR